MEQNTRPTCCWTRCDNEQGVGTWTEINGETLPVCEEHWYGNLDAERRRLHGEVENANETIAVLERQVRLLTVAIDRALHELGVPTSDYPAPVANAVRILDDTRKNPGA